MLLIFDWDGTLCDSTAKIVLCMQKAAEATKLQVLEDELIRNIIGLGMPQAIQALYPELQAQKMVALAAEYSRFFLEADRVPSPFFDGVNETLATLRDEGYQLAVATGKSRRGLDRVLANMGMVGFFHGSRCADETASKPDPRMLHELLEEFDRPAEQAVMVGDTEYDMEMAQRAGVPRVAVSYGAHHIDRMQSYKPLFCVDNFANLLQLIR